MENVIDAYVSVKWFVPEVLTPQALRLLGGLHLKHIDNDRAEQ